MSNEITETEARLALGSIERRRQQVIAEIDVPPWYWLGVAGGWIALGVLADFGPGWGTAVGTLLFGAIHSAIAPHALSGRHRSPRLSVHSEMVSGRIPALVFAFLIIMTIVTVALALVAHADGARHAATLASVVVAAIVVAAGPGLMASVRRRAERHLSA